MSRATYVLLGITGFTEVLILTVESFFTGEIIQCTLDVRGMVDLYTQRLERVVCVAAAAAVRALHAARQESSKHLAYTWISRQIIEFDHSRWLLGYSCFYRPQDSAQKLVGILLSSDLQTTVSYAATYLLTTKMKPW